MRVGIRPRLYLALLAAALTLGPLLAWWVAVLLVLRQGYPQEFSGECRRFAVIGPQVCSLDNQVLSHHLTWVAAFVLPLLLAGAAWLLAHLALRPLRTASAVIDRMGPQNLGQRVRGSGGGRDEMRRLADSVDAMLDRVAAGYDGQRRFAANASHELRTPLAVQRTLVEVAMQAPDDQRDLDSLARQLLATNERNVELIEGLLVLAESDRGLVGVTTVRLDRVAAEVVAVHEESAAAHGVTLELVDAERDVAGDAVLLERMVTNLVQNAIRYNREDGHVRMTFGSHPALVVENTGDPVPAEAVPRLFEPFRRLASDRLGRGGSGLGLAIVRSVATAHGGKVTARPGDDGGLRVEVDLPDARV